MVKTIVINYDEMLEDHFANFTCSCGKEVAIGIEYLAGPYKCGCGRKYGLRITGLRGYEVKSN